MNSKLLFVMIIILTNFTQLFSEDIEKFKDKLTALNDVLIENQVDTNWLYSNIEDMRFKIYYDLEKFFGEMKEKKVDKQEKTWEWFKNHFGLDLKIKMGQRFLKEKADILQKAEDKNDIPKELISALLGMESNYGMESQKGTFYIFNVFVTQYLLFENRKDIAVRELAALYNFEKRSNRTTFYFIGSFAGACGWGQFIPSSLMNYFVDSNNIDENIDIYDLEDCIFSIENYLFNFGLNRENINTPESMYKAIYAYNRSSTYVKAILYIYEGLLAL